MAHRKKLSLRKFFGIILFNFFLTLTLIFIIEGLSASLLFVNRAFLKDVIAERRHTQYDEEIGWINLPNLSIKDMYGSKSFITNAMSFRNDKEFSYSVPDNKVRMICSGDSFTMGYGVGNEDTWCSLLQSIDNRIEPVNLGQGGYGVDQAYLWYKRNSARLEHDIHIFAFITADFYRMQSDVFFGYGKPFFVLQDDVLVNKNLPVPKRSYSIPGLAKAQQAVRQLSSVIILKKLLFQEDPFLVAENKKRSNDQTRKIVLKIFKDLQEINKIKNSILVLVYLPVKSDYIDNSSEEWRRFLNSEATKCGFLFIDLIDEFRRYPHQKVTTLFNGHYSEKGNLYIANILYERLLSIPEIACRFQEK